VTALLVGLKSRAGVFSMQRSIAQFQAEPLMAVLPGVALDELWSVLAVGQQVLELMVVLVGLVSLLALVATIGTALEQRRHELAVLRSLGAGPQRIFALLVIEGALVTGCAAALAWLASVLAIAGASPWLAAHYGLALRLQPPQTEQVLVLAGIVLAGTLASAIPGWRAYRLSITDGLQPRA
jgi:putative ABC transport system permease protein